MFRKKILSLLVSLALILSLSVPVFAENGDGNFNDANIIEGELIVSIENSGALSIQSRSNESIDSVISSSIFSIKDNLLESTGIADETAMRFRANEDSLKDEVIKNMGYVYLVEYPESKLSFSQAKAQLQKTLEKAGCQVKSIEPNFVMKAIETVETKSNVTNNEVGIQAVNPSQKWQYDMIKAPEAWRITSGDRQVKVAVVDTGIDNTHPSLSNYVDTSIGKNFTSGSETDTMDRKGHGTHVAGTIASYGSVSGVMQTATLIPIKVLGDDGYGTSYGVQQGVLYAANQDADVINMSLGGGSYSSTFDSACDTAVASGVVIVAASGNEYASSISYPAAYKSVIAVGAVNSSRQRGAFSNYGEGLAVMAPGVSVYSTYPNGQYTFMNGTSMASPHVAGLAGLMRSANRDISVAEVTSILKNTAQSVGNQKEYGYGIVNALEAVKAASGVTPIDTVATPTFSLPSGTYDAPQNVTISCATEGATIRYTTDGLEPTENSLVYSGTINVAKTTTLKAKAFKDGMTNSATATATYTIRLAPVETVATPAFDPVGGTYQVAQNASILCTTPDAIIRYTTDGTEPTETSAIYNSAINVAKNTTLKAKAFKDGMNESKTAVATYTISDGGTQAPAWKPYTAYVKGNIVSYNNKNYECIQPHTSLIGWEPSNVLALWKEYKGTVNPPIEVVATPTFSPAGGAYKVAQSVTLSCATLGSTIRYTTDGTEPTVNSTLYNGAINVAKTTTIKAKAFKSAMTDSAVATATFTIGDDSGNTAWKPYTAYKLGEIVSYNNKNYKCIQPHTSLPGWEPANLPALWSLTN